MNLLPSEILRLVLLYSHLLLCALAIAQVLKADFAIAFGRFTRESLQRDARDVSLILLLLWVSGLAVTYHDTGFDLAILAAKPKLLLKLVCVIVLTANGAVLHYLSFPVMLKRGPVRRREAVLLALTGALSTSHWLMAAFIGIARPLGKVPLPQLLTVYGGLSLMAMGAGLCFSPMLKRRLTDWRVAEALDLLRQQRWDAWNIQWVPTVSSATVPGTAAMHATTSMHDTPSMATPLPAL